jgi:hypothetical protein
MSPAVALPPPQLAPAQQAHKQPRYPPRGLLPALGQRCAAVCAGLLPGCLALAAAAGAARLAALQAATASTATRRQRAAERGRATQQAGRTGAARVEQEEGARAGRWLRVNSMRFRCRCGNRQRHRRQHDRQHQTASSGVLGDQGGAAAAGPAAASGSRARVVRRRRTSCHGRPLADSAPTQGPPAVAAQLKVAGLHGLLSSTLVVAASKIVDACLEQRHDPRTRSVPQRAVRAEHLLNV